MTDSYTPRRGRPTNAEIAARAEQTDTLQEAGLSEAVSPKNRRKRTPVGGFKQKLAAPQRDGYVRRWVNDDGARPQYMNTDLGYDFVLDKNTSTDGVGSRVSRIVGKKATGEPMHAYLMETPVEEYAVGVAEKEEALKPFEDAIRKGIDAGGEFTGADNTYQPRSGSSLSRS